MSKAFKKAEPNRNPFRRLSDSEILLFVARTLHTEVPDIFTKLQNLGDILDQQEINLLDWPDSPGKDRFYASLLKAKGIVSQIANDLASEAANNAPGSSQHNV